MVISGTSHGGTRDKTSSIILYYTEDDLIGRNRGFISPVYNLEELFMNLKQIEKSKLYQDDWNNCTVIASSIAFNLDYDKTSRFYTLHGRKWGDGLYHFDTNRIIKLLAKQEGYEVDFFAFDKHEAKRLKGVYKWKRGKFIKNPHIQSYKFQADKKNPMD